MAIVHRTIRRLKDTFECTQPYDEITRDQQIIGRRVLSTKKLMCLPSYHESNYNMNFNEIPLAPPLPLSLITKKRQTINDHQSKMKNMVIDELKSFFASRNQNNREKYNNIDSEIRTSFQSLKKQIVPQKNAFAITTIDKEQLNNGPTFKTNYNPEGLPHIPSTSTTLLASISIVTSILLSNDIFRSSKKLSNILSDTLFYSTSFSLGCFGARYIKRTHPLQIHLFGNMLTKSLLLHTFLTLLTSTRTFPLTKYLLFTRQDIFIRLITSSLHLIAGFAINFDNKNVI